MILTLSPADIEAIAEGVAERLGNTTKRLYTVREAAVYLGKTEDAIYAMVAKGELQRKGRGRRVLLDKFDLDAWIEGGKG